MNTNFKLCPFCEGRAELQTKITANAYWFYIACLRCGVSTLPKQTVNDAVDCWQQRARLNRS